MKKVVDKPQTSSPLHDYMDLLNAPAMNILYVTTLGYMVAHAFQFTYLRSYGIHHKLMSINTSTLVLSIGLASLGVAGFIMVTDWFSATGQPWLRTKVSNRVARKFAGICGLYTALLVNAWALSLTYPFLIPGCAVTAIIMGLVANKLLEEQPKKTKPHTKTKPIVPDNLLGKFAMGIVVVYAALIAGKIYTKLDTALPVLESSGNHAKVLIQHNSKDAILKGYNTEKRTFTEGYYLLRDGKEYYIRHQDTSE